ncbi:replication protein A 32 kDa subunit-like isoform X1 [Thunnus maccoyii]|uniref:replication protein A 32 kDa subunit-like isoform X1 n=1 Tax=Thunnus maccoyii TaxID=8240 RepID=UPI001C4A8D48|nr:replication protein A 32 kDa subunit-like isoform X1 [Thunnus maccoyii]
MACTQRSCQKACSLSPDGITSHKAMVTKRGSLEILPCTVSQLLTASQVSNDSFAICDWELHQVSLVGVIRGFAPFVTNVQYSVDDMTGPPLNVKQWVNTEDCALMMFASPGTYVKVTGSLRNFKGQRSLLAMDIRCIKDLNEITSHMLEVVQAHMQLFGKMFDVNMNTTAASLSGRAVKCGGGHSNAFLPHGLSTIQGQVLNVIKSFSVHDDGISCHDLNTQLDYLSMRDIRTSLAFLIREGHVFSTIDKHFKSTEH